MERSEMIKIVREFLAKTVLSLNFYEVEEFLGVVEEHAHELRVAYGRVNSKD